MSKEELNAEFGGGFYHYTDGEGSPAKVFAPRRNSAILLDGSKCAHGTELFHPHGQSEPTMLNKCVLLMTS